MNTIGGVRTRLFRILLYWLVPTAAMDMMMLIGGWIVATLLIPVALLDGTGLGASLRWYFTDPLYMLLFCVVLGGIVGSFRAVWAQVETDHRRSGSLIGITMLAAGVGLPLIFILLTHLPDLFPRIVGCPFTQRESDVCGMQRAVFRVAGLLCGLVFGVLVGFGEWLALRRPVIRLWMWLMVPGTAWAVWCAVIAPALSSWE